MDFAVVALFPEDIDTKIAEFRTQISKQFGPKEALAWPPHLTLRRSFAVPKQELNAFLLKLQGFLKQISPIETELDGFDFIDDYPINPWVKSPYVVAISVKNSKALQEFHEKLEEFEPHSAGGKTPYRPHVTLAYNDVDEQTFYKVKEHLRGKTFKAKIVIDNVTLILNENGVYKKYKILRLG